MRCAPRERVGERRKAAAPVALGGRRLYSEAGSGTNSGSRGAQADVRRIASHLAASGVASIVVDCESGPIRLGLAAQLAAELGAEHVPMADLAATVRTSLDPLKQRGAAPVISSRAERKAA